jgi:hypothetical protein
VRDRSGSDRLIDLEARAELCARNVPGAVVVAQAGLDRETRVRRPHVFHIRRRIRAALRADVEKRARGRSVGIFVRRERNRDVGLEVFLRQIDAIA